MLGQFTLSQIKRHSSRETCWVIVDNKVYDITTFLTDHPGGDDIILKFAGSNITTVLGNTDYHSHSDAAYDILTEYCIGNVIQDETTTESAIEELEVKQKTIDISFAKANDRDKEFLDLREPLFPQLWNMNWSKAYYLEQVHKPRYTPYTVPYFGHPILDQLSKTNWYLVPALWLPFVAFQLWSSVNSTDYTVERTVQGFFSGMLFWTLFEYVLHRFLFHLDDLLPDHPIALLVHFTLHGIHHHMPMDRLRLVMPPALTVILSIPVFKLAHAVFNPACAFAFVGGAFFGYICYDMIHYYLHHAKVIEVYFKELKRYHVAHHYKDFQSGFGITSKLWDYVFGTVLYLDDNK